MQYWPIHTGNKFLLERKTPLQVFSCEHKGGVRRANMQRRFLAQRCCTKNRYRVTWLLARFLAQYLALQRVASF